MYRTFLLVLLSTHAALGAPQESRDTSITYLKVQSPTTDKAVGSQNYRSYSFVPKNAKKSLKNHSNPVISDDNPKNPEIPPIPDAKISKPSDFHESNLTEVTHVPVVLEKSSDINQSNLNVSKSNQDELAIDSKSETALENNKTDSANTEEKGHKNLLKDAFEHLDNEPSELSQFDRHSRDYDYTTTTYDSSETENADYSTEKYEVDTKSAKVLPKLTYFQKFGGSFSNNLIESSGKRRFRSRCRCEKIWNCPKLQITVPRCPDEYFMCCF